MAKINGITVKALKSFRDHEGSPAYQGNIYVSGKKVAFWSQDFHGGICDNLLMEKGYSDTKLTSFVEKSNSDKAIHGKRPDGSEYSIDYSFEFLMHDLITLTNREKTFKKAKKSGFSCIFTVEGSYEELTWFLSDAFLGKTQEEIIKMIGKDKWSHLVLRKGETEPKYHLYKSLDDFVISGKEINLKDIAA